ncbi:MAG: hypothetical protein G01um10142_452 [Parcubacteria group bacterium Gr01-1014_2]|nr:MAG: hypothetical protein G01um10142_452 [Parcubacteria group bacterium Gr01-1014_2]
MKKVLLIAILGILFGQGEVYAQWGFGGTCGVPCAVGGTQNLIWQTAQSWQWQTWQPYGYPNQRLVCRPMSVGHRLVDAGLGALAGGGSTAIWTRNAGAVVGGAAAGAGGVGLYGQHERECWYEPIVVYQPVQPQTVPRQPTSTPQALAPQEPPLVVEPAPLAPSRLRGVGFTVINENPATIVVEIPDGRRAVLGPRAKTRVRTPDIKVFLIQRNDTTGSFDEHEIDLRGLQDESLPGWRIPATVRLKSP